MVYPVDMKYQSNRDYANEFSRVVGALTRLEVWEIEASTVFTHLLLTSWKRSAPSISSLTDPELEDAVLELLPTLRSSAPLDNKVYSVLCEGR